MAKPLKIVLIVLGVVIAMFAALAVAVPLLFNPNNHREQIAKAVKDVTGREFSADTIKLHVFPWLAVELHEVTLGNAPGFSNEPMLKLSDASVGVRLMPLLLDRRVSVSTLTVHGLALQLAKDKNGKDNWSDIGAQDKSAPEQKPASKESDFQVSDLRIGGVDVKDASLSYRDAQAGKSYQLEHMNFSTGELAPDKPFEFKLDFTASSGAPQMQAGVKLASTLAVDFKKQQFVLSNLKLDVDASGSGIPAGKQQASLTGAGSFDAKAGALKITGAHITALGLTIDSDIEGSGLLGDAPRLSGPLRIQPFSPREFMAKLGSKIETADPEALRQMSFAAQYRGSFRSAALDDVTLKLDQTNATGHIDVSDFGTQAAQFALKVDQLDADRYSAPKTKDVKKQVANNEAEVLNETELPGDALNQLNAQGTLDVGQLKVSGLTLTNATVKLSGGRGQVKNIDIGSKLYGGGIAMHLRATPGANTQYSVNTRLMSLDTGAFLKDFAGKDYLTGLGNLELNVAGAGKTVGDLRKSLDGNLALKLEHATVKGVNLASVLRKGQAMLAGNMNYQESAPQQTDFSAISVSGKIANGVLTTSDLAGSSPAFRLAGAGKLDLVSATIDYLVKPTIVETSTGEAGKSLDQLRGITVPIQLSGNLFSPSYKLDVAAALQQKALAKVNDKLEANKGKLEEKVNDALGKLFGGKR